METSNSALKKVRFSPTSYEQCTRGDEITVLPVHTKTYDGINQDMLNYAIVIKQLFNPSDPDAAQNALERFEHLGTLDANSLRKVHKNIQDLCKRIKEGPSKNEKGKYIKYSVLTGGGGFNLSLTCQYIPFIVKYLIPVIRSYIKLA